MAPQTAGIGPSCTKTVEDTGRTHLAAACFAITYVFSHCLFFLLHYMFALAEQTVGTKKKWEWPLKRKNRSHMYFNDTKHKSLQFLFAPMGHIKSNMSVTNHLMALWVQRVMVTLPLKDFRPELTSTSTYFCPRGATLWHTLVNIKDFTFIVLPNAQMQMF